MNPETETILTMPAADVGQLRVHRTADYSPTRFEIWHAYGMDTCRQVGWLIKRRANWVVVDVTEETRLGRSDELLRALSSAAHRIAAQGHQERLAAERLAKAS